MQRLANLIPVDALEHKIDALVHVLVEHGAKHLCLLLILALIAPRPDVRLVVEVFWVHVHHAASRHRRGRRVLQIRHLEEKLAVIHQSNAFAVGQGKEFVVVHDRVHVFDPHRVDVAVEHDVTYLVTIGRQRTVELTEDVRQQAVCPVARLRIELSVELRHRLRLGVDDVQLSDPPELRLRSRQGVDDDGFPAAGVTHHHRGVARHHRLIQLNHLVHLLRRLSHHLIPVLREILLDHVVHLGVSHARAVQPGEQIADEPEKQRDVVEDKLGKVHVSKRAHQDDLFGEVRGAALEGTRHDEHRLQRAESKIVVILL